MKNVSIIDHPIAQKALEQLRNRELPYDQFRYHSEAICKVIIADGTADLEAEDDLLVISILRAGVAMLPAALQIMPAAKVGFVGLQRDEETAIASEYYWKLPEITQDMTVLITDPMFATGGSVYHVLRKLKDTKAKDIRVLSVIAAPEGIQRVHDDFPDVKIYTAAVDKGLDDKKFIVPGLGDYGDRYFGTE